MSAETENDRFVIIMRAVVFELVMLKWGPASTVLAAHVAFSTGRLSIPLT
jgi:hypothetical protein